MSLFPYDPADKKDTLAARAKACIQPVARPAKKHFSLGEGAVLSERAAERSPRPLTPTDFRRLGKHTSIWPSRIYLGLALRTSPHKKIHPSPPHEDCEVMTLVLGSKLA